MKRRTFVKGLPTLPAGLALGAAGMTSGGCAGPAWIVPTPGPAGTLALERAELGDASATLVELPGSGRPLLLLRRDGGWVALHASCTHRGCQPDPVGDRLVCPCHGSEFSLDGEVLEGPAERPLRRFPVREDGGRVLIDVGARP